MREYAEQQNEHEHPTTTHAAVLDAVPSLAAGGNQQLGRMLRPPSDGSPTSRFRPVVPPLSRQVLVARTPTALASVGGQAARADHVRQLGGRRQLGANDRGFANSLRASLPARAAGRLRGYESSRLHEVHGDFGDLLRGAAQLHVSGRPGSAQATDISLAPPSVRTFMTQVGARSGAMSQMMLGQHERERARVESFNRWVPRANDVFRSLAQLEAVQDAYGIDDTGAMVSAIESSLHDAQGIAERALGNNRTMTPPRENSSVLAAQREAGAAQRQLIAAGSGVRSDQFVAQAEQLRAQGAGDRARQQAIQEVIQTWTRLGQTVDVAIAAMGSARGFLQDGGGTAAIEDDGLPVQPQPDASGSARSSAIGLVRPAGAAIGVPTSAAGVTGLAAQTWYAAETDRIAQRLGDLDTWAARHTQLAGELGVLSRVQQLRGALENYRNQIRAFEAAQRDRQADYMRLGSELDNEARRQGVDGGGSSARATVSASASVSQAPVSGQAGQGQCRDVPAGPVTATATATATAAVEHGRRGGDPRSGPPRERFMAVMLVTSAIRESLAGIAAARELATGAEVTPAQMQAFLTSLEREVPEGCGPRAGGLTEGEYATLDRIYSQSSVWLEHMHGLEARFAPVEAAAGRLMQSMQTTPAY